MKRRASVFFILLIAYLSLSSNPKDSAPSDVMSFNAYGFCYVKIKNEVTGKFLYLFTNSSVKHCCGDMTQQNNFIMYINKAAGNYIAQHMTEPANQFKLLPTFSKCLKTNAESENVRQKKISYFKSLNYEVVEVDMNILSAVHCN